MLEYSRISEYSLAAKAKWLVVAFAVTGVLGVVMQMTNFVLYLSPRSFRGVGTGLVRNGKTDWYEMSLELISLGIMMWTALSAVAFLRGYRVRRSLVRAAWAQIVIVAVGTVAAYFQYYRRAPLPD